MKMFDHSNSTWVRYSEYEWKQDENGKLYLTACADAQPAIYDPLKEYQQLVLDALYIGRLGMKQEQDDTEIQSEIKDFAEKYGLFGLLTALPTTPSFMDYEAVYLSKNRFIKKETMSTEEYLALFFPFDKINVVKRSVESLWNIEGNNMMALAMTMSDRPMAVNMSFQRQYAESYEWMKQVFTDWAFNATTVFLYYNDYDRLDEDYKQLMRQSKLTLSGTCSHVPALLSYHYKQKAEKRFFRFLFIMIQYHGKRKNPMKKSLPIIAIALIFLIGVGILSYPLVSSVINNIEDRRHAQDELIKIENMGEKKRDALFDEAEEYNRKLISTVLLTDPFDDATYEKIEDIYRQSFNVNEEGLIGYIEIAKIDVFLPIYHGTSKEVLERGAGHLENTSFPVGGASTHSVISAHSAFPTRTFFDYLPDLKEGDKFVIHVLDELLTYQIDQIKVVLPDKTDDLYVIDGEDYVTLLTCTPYSINTHRLLVRGKRVPNDAESIEPVRKIVSAEEGSVFILGYRVSYVFAAIGIIAFVAAVGLIVFIILHHSRKRAKAKPPKHLKE